MLRTALCLSWTPSRTLDDNIGGLQCIAKGAEGEATVQRLCSAMDARKDITSGVYSYTRGVFTPLLAMPTGSWTRHKH